MDNIGVVLAISLIGLIIDCIFIKSEYAGQMLKATVLKGIAAAFFVALGVYCYVNNQTNGGMLIVIGLALGMLGDIFLNMRNLYEGAKSNKIFAIGILAFLSGHFLYIAFLMQRAFDKLWIALVMTVVIAVVAIPPLMKRITAPSKGLKIFGYVYLTIVICMFSCSVAMLISQGISALTFIFVGGAFLFMISDFIMIYYSFGKKIKPLRAINLLSYYVGQLLIAYCISLIT